MSTEIKIFPGTDELVEAAGQRLIGVIADAIAARGRATIVLTGGGNGTGLLRYLATKDGQIDWSKVHVFWGDDRYVAEDDDERNEKQAREALLDHVDIPASQVHPMAAGDGEYGADIDAAALAYEQILAANAAPGDPAPNSTSTCWAWVPRATSTRCSRTPRRCVRPAAWWWRWRTPPSPHHSESR